MAQPKQHKPQPEINTTSPPAPVVFPDGNSQRHPSGPVVPPNTPSVPPAGTEELQKVLPQINEVAQKVGGFKKLSEIADTLEQTKE